VQALIRGLAIAGLFLAGLLAAAAGIVPASAGSGVSCTGNDCPVPLSNLITHRGGFGRSGAGAALRNLPGGRDIPLRGVRG
jgi:hypothetical protein